MLLMGDELGRRQEGNNNAYCQDGPLSWLDWGEADAALLAYTRRLVALRRTRKLLRQQGFLHGQERDAQGRPDVTWLAEDGQVLSTAQWQDPGRRSLGLRLAGAGEAPLLLLLNAGAGPVTFRLPDPADGGGWRRLLDTADDEPAAGLVTAALTLTGAEPDPARGRGGLSPAPPSARADGASRRWHGGCGAVMRGDEGSRARRHGGAAGLSPGCGEARAGGQPRRLAGWAGAPGAGRRGGRPQRRRRQRRRRAASGRSGRCARCRRAAGGVRGCSARATPRPSAASPRRPRPPGSGWRSGTGLRA